MLENTLVIWGEESFAMWMAIPASYKVKAMKEASKISHQKQILAVLSSRADCQ